MKAVCWFGKHDMRVERVPDPRILNRRDAILKITRTAICGSDLHLYNGWVPTMEQGDIVGHEFMGEVVEVGPDVKDVKVGDKLVVPFTICCGGCFFCKHDLWSACENTNPNAWMLEGMYGHTGAGLFGYSHLYGGFAGGQAQYARVPFADVGPIKVPEGVTDDEMVLFLSDIFPTGYQAADVCELKGGETVAVWGCGPVGLFAIKSAYLLGAERVIAIDRFEERLVLAAQAGAEVLNYEETPDLVERLKVMTGGIGPDACIDAVGMEAHGHSVDAKIDDVKQKLMLQPDRANVLRQIIQVCRPGGTVSVPGVYTNYIDKMPWGQAFGKALTFKMGQTHMVKYLRPLMELIRGGKIDPKFLISHRIRIEDAPQMYKVWNAKQDNVTKIVIDPWREAA